ncbi:radical SAM protein [Sulfitobacter sp. HNIBRBA2951]|uniref:radical SAM protein n=1 Tax=Sulfitobacter aquimarinus TaxID=3158557 RepID=UPI0032E00E04
MTLFTSRADLTPNTAVAPLDMAARFTSLSLVYLRHDPAQMARYERVQLFADWAEQTGCNLPIHDVQLVATLRGNDGFVAIQCRLHAPAHCVTHTDLGGFLTAPHIYPFKSLLILALTDVPWDDDATDAVSAAPVPVECLGRHDLEDSAVNWPYFARSGEVVLVENDPSQTAAISAMQTTYVETLAACPIIKRGMRGLVSKTRFGKYLPDDQANPARPQISTPNVERGPFTVSAKKVYADLEILLSLTWAQSQSYAYSKLYYRMADQEFSEDRTVCFKPKRRNHTETLRLALPEFPIGATVFFRIDASAHGIGTLVVDGFDVAPHSADSGQTVLADYNAAKEQTRAMVIQSEAGQKATLAHYPESLSIELTAGCNLTCSHCSSHGTGEVHDFHNRLQRFTPEGFTAMADEVFPYLTSICLVGRGEPTFVSHQLWECVFEKAKQYNVLVSIVTNGLLLTKRLRPEHMPWVDTMMFSIDGYLSETMAANRGNVSLTTVVEALRHYDKLRRSTELARRPKLSVSFTLKRNNIAEFAAFIEAVAQFQPDLVYSRHLLIFFEKQANETLLTNPEIANHYLAQAYAAMARHNIPGDCPPIVAETADTAPAPDVIDAMDRAFTSRRAQSAPIWKEQPNASVPCLSDGVVDPIGDALLKSKQIERAPLNLSQLAATIEAKPDLSQMDTLPPDRCIYFHRTGVLMADQSVVTCARPYAAAVGSVGEGKSFAQAWNSRDMVQCRGDFGTDKEWSQCKECWYRESRYAGQRDKRSEQQAYDMDKSESSYDLKSWDFRAELDNEVRDTASVRKPGAR